MQESERKGGSEREGEMERDMAKRSASWEFYVRTALRGSNHSYYALD